MPLFHCKAVDSHSLRIVLRNAPPIHEHASKVEMTICIPLCRCKAVKSHSLCMVLRNATSTFEQNAQVAQRDCMPLGCCKVVPSLGLCEVLLNAPPCMVALTNQELAHAAARCSAFPSELKAHGTILGSASSIRIAVAKHALVVHAAHVRAD